jgi:hypothetical protein
MAEWQYRIERVNFQPGREADVHLEKILREYGQQGWELVQVLHGHELANDPEYRLILKAEKPLD